MPTGAAVRVPIEYKLYKRRWLMMALFFMYAFNSSIQWAQYTIITDLVTQYYVVSATHVEWTSMVFTLSFVLFVLPSIYVIDKLGIRYTMILGGAGITLGTWIKVFSVASNRFILVLAGQASTAVFTMLTFGLFGRFPAAWFGADEISTASVLSILGDQVGVSLAFLLPPIFVKKGTNEEIGAGLKRMNLFIAGTSTIIFVLIVLLFQSKPPLPPSIAQAKKDHIKKPDSVWKVMKNVIMNRSVLLIMISYTLVCGPYTAIATLLNQLIFINFPDKVHHAGNIGALMMISGTVCSLVIGPILDKTKMYKQATLWGSLCAAITVGCFTIVLKLHNIWYIYAIAAGLGVFNAIYFAAGFQVGLELTYPAPESISTAVLFLASQFGAFILTLVYGSAVKNYGDLTSNFVLTIIYVLGSLIVIPMAKDWRRTKAENVTNDKELQEFL